MPVPTKKWEDLPHEELAALAREMQDHLDYCGWGDRWERECSEDLRKKCQEIE